MKRLKGLFASRRGTAAAHKTTVAHTPEQVLGDVVFEQKIFQEARSPSLQVDHEPVHAEHGDNSHTAMEPLFRSYLETKGKEGQKAVAREIVKVLQDKFQLTSYVKISDLLKEDPGAELTKVQSLFAVSTQRAAALFALEVDLLEETKRELQGHIKATKAFKSGWHKEAHKRLFVTPLEEELRHLDDELAKAQAHKQGAQQRFRELREGATRPIMQGLLKDSQAYTHLFKTIPKHDITQFCVAVHRLQQMSNAKEQATQHIHLRHGSQETCNSVEHLRLLYCDAVGCQPKLKTVLTLIRQRCNDVQVHVEVEMGDLKSVERAMEKTVEEYDGNFMRLLDLVRGSVICTSVADATRVVDLMASLAGAGSNDDDQPHFTLEIIRVKNRMDPLFSAASESGGYRDLLVNVRINGGHICELQIHLRSLVDLKKQGGHKTYTIARSLHLLDPNLGRVRVSQQDGEIATTVRQSVREALDRVQNGACQSLYLNHVTLTENECHELKAALRSPASNVREIYLPNCGIDTKKSSILAEQPLGQFRIVDLYNNEGITGDCVAMFISDELQQLNLEECKVAEWESVANAFKQQPERVTTLKLNWNKLGPEEIQIFFPALTMMTNMTNLNLTSAELGPEGAKYLAAALAMMTTNMTELYLSSNEFGPEGAEHLAPALTMMINMTDLNLGSNELGAEGTKHLVPALTMMTHLTSLQLYTNKLGPEGAEHLVPALTRMANLTNLQLYRNKFGPKGAKCLAPALAMMTNMINLNLERNELGPEGAKILTPALTLMTNMTNLNLWNNRLTPEGAMHITPALAMMTNMTTLNLHDNGLAPEGAKHLAPALAKMTNLTDLNLRSNRLAPEGAKHIAPVLSKMTNLINLELRDNNLDDETEASLKESLKHISELFL